MTPEQRQLIKYAQKELVALCGGAEAVAALTHYGRSTVYRWADTGDTANFMPIPVVCTLENGRPPVVTAAMATGVGRTLTDTMASATPAQCVHTAMAETIVASAMVNRSYGEALADGKVTPNELNDFDEALGLLIRKAQESRRTVASSRAAGGLAVVGGR